MSGWICPTCDEVERNSMVACGSCGSTPKHAALFFQFLSRLWFKSLAKQDVCHVCGTEPDVPADATGQPACNNCYVCNCPVCKPSPRTT